ncbi:MAG: hypothetical protein E6Y25_06935 [Sneathia sanguinegens]|uniref:hypothetical protein n=1 Tax=Sneathia sanguinegens TaxID=40543 RepID=UPI002909E152|nr:hypothetical protein [Sneathia sanguinegens]MDU4653149.1 hypothetical protein [Sneathia sanguinegens]
MKKICVLSLLFSLVSFSKGYIETYGKFNIESNGNYKVDEAGVRLNVEQGKFKFKTNIGLNNYQLKVVKKDLLDENKDFLNYAGYFAIDSEDITKYYENTLEKNISRSTNAKLEYTMIDDENLNSKFNIEYNSYDYSNIYRYAKIGSNLKIKFKDGSAFGTDSEIYLGSKVVHAYIEPYVETKIKNMAKIRGGLGLGCCNYPVQRAYVTAELNGDLKFNENTTMEMKNSAIFSKEYIVDGRTKFAGFDNFDILYDLIDENERGYFVYANGMYDGYLFPSFMGYAPDVDLRLYPLKLIKTSIKLKNSYDNFKLEIMPFGNLIVGEDIKHRLCGIYGLNVETFSKFLDKYTFGSNVRMVGLDSKDFGINEINETYNDRLKTRSLDTSFYVSYLAKINDKFSIEPKIKVGYFNKYLKLEGEKNSHHHVRYNLHKVKGEASILAKYMITDSLSMSAGILGGLKFVKGKIIECERLLKKDTILNKYLKLSFNMKYEWR